MSNQNPSEEATIIVLEKDGKHYTKASATGEINVNSPNGMKEYVILGEGEENENN